MAAGETIFVLLTFALSLPQCFCNERFGHNAEHLHVQLKRHSDFGNSREFAIGAREKANSRKSDGEASGNLRGLSHELESVNRIRRNIHSHNVSSNFNISVFTLNDSHFQLTVHWAGRGSNVVVALAKDNNRNKQNGSVVFISYDYGKTFINKNSLLKINDATPAIINRFFNSPVYNSHYVFTDLVHQYIFTTTDYGLTFDKIQLPFVPDVVSLHITNEKVILAMSKNDTEKKLWLSEDFGETWTIMQPNVKSFFWGIKGLDNENVLYIERLEPSGKSTILRHPDFSSNMQNIEVLITEVEDFQLKDKYVFATRRQRLLGSHLANGTLQLWVSYNRGPFQRAVFPNQMVQADYYIADASEDQVFVCVNHENMQTNLYISDARGVEYSLSLERIMYFNPKGAGSDSWLSFVAEESFAELYKVEGLKGIYIASQLKKGFERDGLGPEDLTTVISFDKGGNWMLLKPPAVDQWGQTVKCNLTTNCSLHLSQRFSQLYPPSRSTLIRSQSSAVGLIMASGVMGQSLKGHNGVFLSTDAGSSWHKILDDNYFYTFGDHGGIIVAVKAYVGAGETNELIYSTDEGETWEKLIFSPEKICVYGLMTEPGEKTTIFTLFGSRPDKHQWLIITVDLKPAFSHLCKSDEYKQWSPTDAVSGEYRHCLLGQQEVYQRRISRAKCYNGRDYEGVVILEKCECKLEDYSCDVGFKWDEATNRMCLHDKDSNIDPYAIPDPCPPGTFYNRSKGYRKVSGDVCIEGLENRYKPQQIACPISSIPEFILFTQRQVINRMSLASEAQVEHLRIPNLRNVIAVEYDFRNNCLYWGDVDDDTILSLCLNGKSEPEILVETGLASIEGLALDWLTNNLYFVDGEMAKIEVIRTDIKHLGRLRRTIQAAPTLEKPRGIALHPLRGVMFWTDWGSTQPCISKSFLDGSGVKQLITKPNVYWPNGITIDYHTDRIYWVDAKLDYIASAGYDGQDMKFLIRSSSIIPHPFAIGIYKDWMYWDDWTRQAILVADKFDGSGVQVVASGLSAIMDLKIYDRGIQRGENPCSVSNCTHLCMKSNQTVVCLCPDGFHIEKQPNGNEKCFCEGDQLMNENGTCSQKTGGCRNGSFACHSGQFCIPSVWQCDGDNDCADGSDEKSCDTRTCSSAQFACRTGRCIPVKWRCDSERDCTDGSDEENCKQRQCDADEFRCKNGMCIDHNWVCDMDNDCHDGSDEENCSTSKPICEDGEFHCKAGDQCLHQAWRCDGDTDCLDGSDEENCSNYSCQSWQHQCMNGHCIFKSWVCDGHDDCKDGSDENNCEHATTSVQTTTPASGSCSPWLFTCHSSGKCVPIWWKCDRVSDCTDGSDEFNCAYTTTSTAVTTVPPTTPVEQCGENHYRCLSGHCIYQSWVCDSEPDCPNGEDEVNCTLSCGIGHVHCLHSAGCIPLQYMCNGIVDCADGSDEHGCSSTEPPVINTTNCGLNSFECKYGLCIPALKRCDGHKDCLDSSDEENCTTVDRDYFLDTLNVDLKGVTKDRLSIGWTPRSSNKTQLEYSPAIREFNTSVWTNYTWINETYFTFTHLKPYTLYFMTVFIRAKGNKHVSTPVTYEHFRTMPDVSSPPRQLSFNIDNSNKVTLKWSPPLYPNSRIMGYRLYITPPTPPAQTEIPEPLARSYTVENYFKPGVAYSVWLTTIGEGMESNVSNVVTFKIDPKTVVGAVSHLKMLTVNNNSVVINWDKLENAQGYEISVVARRESSKFDSQRLPKYKSQKIESPPFNVTGLSPGVVYDVKVSAFRGDNRGPSTAIKVRTGGEILKSPRAVQARMIEETSVQLNWELPNDNRNIQWEYGVYYGTSWDDLSERGIAGRTSNLTYRISKLDSCESYMFTVRIIGPIGLGPAGNVSYVTTGYHHQSPPKKPICNVKDLIATIEWKTACEGIRDYIGFKIRIHDEILDKTSWFQLAPSQNYLCKYVVNINYGGRYTVQVQTNYNESRLTKPVEFSGPPLPPPYQIKLMKTPTNDYELDWKIQNLPEVVSSHRYSYVLSISQNESDFTRAEIHEAIEPKYSLSNLIEGRIYYISVQLKDQKGYLSDPSDVFTFAIPIDNESVVLSTTSIVSILVPVVVILLGLVVAFGVLYMRHKRLQRVTLSFANSHYNTRSGATTFSTGDDLGDFIDEEDSPMIRGFSDDEPLVIA